MRGSVPEFWEHLYKLCKAYDHAAKRLQEAMTEAAAPRPSRWGIIGRGSGPHASSVEKAAERLEVLRAEYDAARCSFLQEWGKVAAIGPRFSDPVLYCVAVDRYFCGYAWDTVAEKLGYTRRHCLRLHHEMIREAARLFSLL